MATLQKKIDAAKPTIVVKTSQLQLKVEALQKQVTKATKDIQDKHDLCEKIKGEALDLCDAVEAKNLEIDRLNEEIAKAVMFPPKPPPAPSAPTSLD